ncbi:MAG: IS110 family transposase [Chloroflexota bacterium]|nr:IS110 family transposase [Chloroflexota bacterium]
MPRRPKTTPTFAAPQSLPAQLPHLNLNAAGIDIGATSHFVAVPEGRDVVSVREFATFTADLHKLADWLEQCGVDTVVMESTGVYWIPLFEILDARGFQVLLVNARHVKNVSGRKSDVLDCQWLQQLHTYGLLTGAFRPADEIIVLRSYLRQRAMLVQGAAMHIQHMQKALQQMNLLLHHVVSDITGTTGMTIIRAILAGERDPHILAQYRDYRCKHSAEVIANSLVGNYRAEHLFALQQAVTLYEVYQAEIVACDQQIEQYLATFTPVSPDPPPPPAKPRQRTGNPFHFDAHAQLYRMTGVDLTRIAGIDAVTALTVLGEIGTDMTRWKTVKHFTSWLGLCPGTKVSGGKVQSSKTKPTVNRAAAALRLAAASLYRSRSALGAYLRRMTAKLGKPAAITATAHKLARLIYSMLRYGTEYVDVGQDYYERAYKERVVRNLTRRAKELGFVLVPETVETAVT